jgi:2-amino-4-hydroxy-6-hydroxymethyldihydropteridine diphosphokinase
MHTAYIGLGANLGDAAQALRAAAQALQQEPGISRVDLSPLYRSAPVDSSGPDYLNAVARIATTLQPLELLAVLQAIENRQGRERPYRNAPRTLDLDLLLFDEQTLDLPTLVVPHPRMHLRAFVLRPLLDLAPHMKLPQGPAEQLLEQCGNQSISRY